MGGVTGIGFDTLRHLTVKHFEETFSEPTRLISENEKEHLPKKYQGNPKVFVRPLGTPSLSHTSSKARKIFFLGSTMLGAVVGGVRAFRRAKAHNVSADTWRDKLSNESYKDNILFP